MVGRDPVEVLEDYMGSGRQRNPDAPGHDVAEGDPDLRVVLKPIDGLVPVLRAVGPP